MTDKPKKPGFFADKLGPLPSSRKALTNSTSIPTGATIRPEELATILFEKLMARQTFIDVPADAYTLVTSTQDLPQELQVIQRETLEAALKIVTTAVNKNLNDGSGLYEDAEIFLSKDISTFGISFDGGLEPEEILAALTTQQADIAAALKVAPAQARNSGTSVRIPIPPAPTSQDASAVASAHYSMSPTDVAKILLDAFITYGGFTETATQDHALIISPPNIAQLRSADPETITKGMEILTSAIGTVFAHDQEMSTECETIGCDIPHHLGYLALIFDQNIDDPETIRTALKDHMNVIKADLSTEARILAGDCTEISRRTH